MTTTNTVKFLKHNTKLTEAGRKILSENGEGLKAGFDYASRILDDYGNRAVEGNLMHNNHCADKALEPFAGIALMQDGTVVELMDNTIFCLNEVYINDMTGELHLSQYSVAGNVNTRVHPDMGEAIDAYNKELDEAVEAGWPCGVNYVVAYWLFS